jgi:PST family polysaccharide transporter
MFANSLMTFYFLPRFAEIDNRQEFRKEIFSFYKKIMPFIAIGLLIIYIIRPYIVAIFLTNEFETVQELFGWQLLGDFVKVLSVVMAYQFIAKKMVLHYVITELILVGILYFTSIYFVDMFGIKGAPIAHFVTYLLYFGMMLLIFKSSLIGKIKEANQN